MIHPLSGACEKLRRAESQLAQIDQMLTGYRPHKEYDLVQDKNLNKPFHLFHLKVYEQPPRDLAGVVGEFSHNLRTALNRPLWELSRTSGQAFDERDVEFPIFREFRSDAVWKRVRALADTDAREIVRGLQPYHRGDDAHLDLLWQIHRLNGLDKYQIDHGLGFLARTIISFGGAGFEAGISVRSFENDTPITIPKVGLPADIELKFDFTIGIAIPDSEREGRGSFVPREYFHAMYQYSRGIVLSFERFFS